MSSIFTKIVNGEIPCHKIAENEHFLSFLDINPVTEGHALVIPKKEVDYIFDLDDETLAQLHVFAKKVGLCIEKAIPCQRIGVIVYGLEVPHAHVHLIPINKAADMNISSAKLNPTPAQLTRTAEKIKEHTSKL